MCLLNKSEVSFSSEGFLLNIEAIANLAKAKSVELGSFSTFNDDLIRLIDNSGSKVEISISNFNSSIA